MKTEELIKTLEEKGFKEEKHDTGLLFKKSYKNVELTCYIEPDMEVEFIAVYKWRNNDVKGTYNLSMAQLNGTGDAVISLFRKTKSNMPQQIGDKVNAHVEVEEAIDAIFL